MEKSSALTFNKIGILYACMHVSATVNVIRFSIRIKKNRLFGINIIWTAGEKSTDYNRVRVLELVRRDCIDVQIFITLTDNVLWGSCMHCYFSKTLHFSLQNMVRFVFTAVDIVIVNAIKLIWSYRYKLTC